MSTLFLKIFNMSITAGWLILAVIVLRLLLQKAPKWISCLLWAFVAIRLLCPISIESTLSLIPTEKPVQEQTIFYSHTPVTKNGVIMQNDTASVPEHPLETALPDADGNSWNPLLYLCSLVWIAGILLMLVYAVFGYVRLLRQTEISMRLRDNVFLCDAISTSFILGIIRPRIFLPSGMDETQKAHVLAHENAHIRRHDHWWKALGFLLLTCYWFSPLCWTAYILFCRDMELACDEKVIRDFTFHDRKEYSKTLLSFSTENKIFTVCPLAFGEVGVKKRISAVLNYKRPAFWAVLLSVAVCLAAAVCFLTDPPEVNSFTVPENIGTKNSSAKDAEETTGNRMYLENENKNAHLELVSFDDHAPYYILSFQKIDDKTGKPLLFEEPAEPLQVNLVPNQEDYSEFWWGFHGKENHTDTVTMGFWKKDTKKSIPVTLDGLEYEVVFPEVKPKELEVNQKITMDSSGSATLLETATVYPKALLLKISGFHEISDFLNPPPENRIYIEDSNSPDGNGLRKAHNIAHNTENGCNYFLFLFEEAPPEKFTLKTLETRSKHNEYPEVTYYDTTISLESK